MSRRCGGAPAALNGGTRGAIASGAVLLFTAALLSACWTPPRIPPRAPGPPREIARGLPGATSRNDLVVQAIDARVRRVTLFDPKERSTASYRVAAHIRHLEAFHVGEHVNATLIAQLTVFVPPIERSTQAGGDARSAPASSATSARVAAVDVSYRILTVQLRGGLRENFKLPLGAKLQAMQSGDDVTIRPEEVVALARGKRLLGVANE